MNSIQELTEEIYTKIANRVLKRKQKLKVMNFQIIDGYYNREKLLSSIMHNKRIPKRNPYLLNDKISKCIVRNLKFSSQYELVWGKDSEYDYFMWEVFETGVTYLEQSTEYSDLVHNCLYTYLPLQKFLLSMRIRLDLKSQMIQLFLIHLCQLQHMYTIMFRMR